ncbi:hypothetical protein PCE1_003246 [Barthelona sp. PCE]
MLEKFKAILKPFGGAAVSSSKIFDNLYGEKKTDIKSSIKRGDWVGFDDLISLEPSTIIDVVKDSGIRGRGGAGFSTGLKWSFMPKDDGKKHFLVVNGDEGEPGTSKDRYIMLNEPHKLVEGCVLAGRALGATEGVIYIRGEFIDEMASVQKAIDECYDKGLLGNILNKDNFTFDLRIHPGAGAYVCGEETALIESIEGKPGRPRNKPPYPAQAGLYGLPTMVNNVETISSIPTILRKGSDWFSVKGTENSKGTKLFTVSGDVHKPCVVEEDMGIAMTELLSLAGGVDGKLQALQPGGSSTGFLLPEEVNTALCDYDSLSSYGSALGTGATIVLNEKRDMIDYLTRLARFYAHESCGQCLPCRMGMPRIYELMKKFSSRRASKKDLRELETLVNHIPGKTICALGEAGCEPIRSVLEKMPHLFHSIIEVY